MLTFFAILLCTTVILAVIYVIVKYGGGSNVKIQRQPAQFNFIYENEKELKGAAFNICKTLDIWEGKFEGYITITFNTHDKYAIGVFTNDRVLVGWLPKGSMEVYNYLKTYKIKRLPAHGFFTYQQYRDNIVYFKTHIKL